MNYFSRKKIVILVIAVLLVINIASISTIIYHSYENKRIQKHLQQERTSMRNLKQELNLKPEQLEKMNELGKTFYQNTRAILEKMHGVRIALINEMSSANPDTAKMFAMADDIGLLHAQIKRETVRHFLELKKNCTPEQFEQFLKMFHRLLMDGDYNRWPNRQGNERRPMDGNRGNNNAKRQKNGKN